MDKQQNERRAAMVEKVRKVLNLARGNANANEEAAALQSANRLMAEWGIAEAEVDMAILDNAEMEFGEVEVGPDGKLPKQGKVYRSFPSWAGILAVGVAKFTDSIVVRNRTEQGEVLVFRGEKNDVLFARWLFSVLVESIQTEQKKSGWTKRGEASTFRTAAASALARRLKSLADERQAMYRQAQTDTGCRAVMVVDRKRSEIGKYFGQQRTSRCSSTGSCSGAHFAGQAAGSRINIPSGPPLGSTQRKAIA